MNHPYDGHGTILQPRLNLILDESAGGGEQLVADMLRDSPWEVLGYGVRGIKEQVQGEGRMRAVEDSPHDLGQEDNNIETKADRESVALAFSAS